MEKRNCEECEAAWKYRYDALSEYSILLKRQIDLFKAGKGKEAHEFSAHVYSADQRVGDAQTRYENHRALCEFVRR